MNFIGCLKANQNDQSFLGKDPQTHPPTKSRMEAGTLPKNELQNDAEFSWRYVAHTCYYLTVTPAKLDNSVQSAHIKKYKL